MWRSGGGGTVGSTLWRNNVGITGGGIVRRNAAVTPSLLATPVAISSPLLTVQRQFFTTHSAQTATSAMFITTLSPLYSPTLRNNATTPLMNLGWPLGYHHYATAEAKKQKKSAALAAKSAKASKRRPPATPSPTPTTPTPRLTREQKEALQKQEEATADKLRAVFAQVDEEDLHRKLEYVLATGKQPRLAHIHLLFEKVTTRAMLRKAFRMYYRLQSRLVEPTPSTAQIMYDAGMRVNGLRIIISHWRQPHNFRIFPSLDLYHQALQHYGGRHNGQGVKYVWEAIAKRLDVHPTLETLEYAVHSMVNSRGVERMDHALKIAKKGKQILSRKNQGLFLINEGVPGRCLRGS
eukprot:TRINITY_DN3903_c0_g2_i1.p1 TRINITY_DN3903_c0_g2~~TRINITY_DN3903_c0_g2_i1.p1  ORF type:complete len:351 (-),score=76.32 TRINITY_DN3903_c0_g2_i1:61-1113(-)